MYQDGQIITKSEYKAFANWNNANGGKYSITPNDNGTYTITEYTSPEMSDYEKAQERIATLKNLLAGTDYVVLKIAEGVATKDDYASVLDIRQQWRAEINELELVVDNSQIIV